MPRQTTTDRVIVASPSDCEEERVVVPEVIDDWNDAHSLSRDITVLRVKWETNSVPELGDRPQAIINKQLLKDADILVATFWSRVGTPTGEAASGTIEEIEEFRKAGRPVLVYFSTKPVPANVDTEQLEKLRAYKRQLQQSGICFDYPSIEEFRRHLTKHLNRKISELHQKTESSLSSSVTVEPIDERFKKFREFADDFDSFLREFETKWSAEQEVRQINLNQGKSHLLSAYDHVLSFTTRIKYGLDEVKNPLKDTLVKIRRLQDHQLYADGGQSMAQFWHAGNDIIAELKNTSSIIHEVESRLTSSGHSSVPEHPGPQRGPTLSDLASSILQEAVKDKNGMILMYNTLEKAHVATNNQDFIESDSPRSEAAARAAVNELQRTGMIEQRGKESFGVTAAGFEWADKQTR